MLLFAWIGNAVVTTPEYFQEELLLSAEVMKQSGLTKSRLLSDLTHGGPVISALGKKFERGFKDFIPLG